MRPICHERFLPATPPFTPKLQSWYIPTVVRLIQIGEAQIATYPGEVLPNLVFKLRVRWTPNISLFLVWLMMNWAIF